MIFDGKAFAREIEEQVKNKVRNLPAQAGLVKKPRIVSVMVGDDPASALYTRLKQAAAERVGIEFDVIKQTNVTTKQLRNLIAEIGEREDVSGLMVQLPIPGLQGQTLQDVLGTIPLRKDVDGLRWQESGVMPATVRAVLSIVDEIAADKKRFVVLGARGAVGKPLVHFLRQRGVEVTEIEWDTPNSAGSLLEGEVIISCVGKAGLVTGEMVQDEVVAIDVGMSTVNIQSSINNNQTNQNTQNSKQFGDWNLDIGDSRQSRVVGDMTQEVYQKASVAVPVPGGVGPVTVASLMINAVDLI